MNFRGGPIPIPSIWMKLPRNATVLSSCWTQGVCGFSRMLPDDCLMMTALQEGLLYPFKIPMKPSYILSESKGCGHPQRAVDSPNLYTYLPIKVIGALRRHLRTLRLYHGFNLSLSKYKFWPRTSAENICDIAHLIFSIAAIKHWRQVDLW